MLSDHFRCELHEVVTKKKGIARYIFSLVDTYKILRDKKPRILFVQNPSMFLALGALLVRPFFGYTLIVDRHTNFKFKYRNVVSLKWIIFFCLSRFTLKHSDITIVTNKGLARIVKSIGGNPFVLQDKLPHIAVPENATTIIDQSYKNYLFVCSFGSDEPIDEVITAFSSVNDESFLYITGNWTKRYSKEQVDLAPSNVIFTGFVSDDDFAKLMGSVDGVIVLTENEFTLNCGAYEALSLNKPLMLSNTLALRSYFKDLAVYSNLNSKEDIILGFEKLKKLELVPSNVRNSAVNELNVRWMRRAEQLNRIIS